MLAQCPGYSTEFDPTVIFQRILVPVDFGPESRRALITACELRRRFGSEIRLFVVHETSESVLSPGPSDPWMRDDLERSACDDLHGLANGICKGVPCMKCDALHGGDVVNGIAKAVQKYRTTVVLLPCSGRKSLLRTRAERIVHSVKVPVILLKELEGAARQAAEVERCSPAEKPVILTPAGRLIANPRWNADCCACH